MTVSVAATTVLLEDVLVESPSFAASNAAGWSSTSQNDTPQQLAALMASQPEASIAEQVFRLYEGLLGHKPDSSGMQTYVGQAEAGLTGLQISNGTSSVPASTWNTIVSELMNTTEYAARFPVFTGAQGPELTVANLYGQILQRAPSSAEQAFYVNQINSGTSMNTLLQEFVNSSEFTNDTKAQIDNSLASAGATDVQNNSGATHTYTEITFGHGSSDAVAVIGVSHTHAAPLHV